MDREGVWIWIRTEVRGLLQRQGPNTSVNTVALGTQILIPSLLTSHLQIQNPPLPSLRNRSCPCILRRHSFAVSDGHLTIPPSEEHFPLSPTIMQYTLALQMAPHVGHRFLERDFTKKTLHRSTGRDIRSRRVQRQQKAEVLLEGEGPSVDFRESLVEYDLLLLLFEWCRCSFAWVGGLDVMATVVR